MKKLNVLFFLLIVSFMSITLMKADVIISNGGGGSTTIAGGGNGSVIMQSSIVVSTTSGIIFSSNSFTAADGTALTAYTGEIGGTWVQHSSFTGVFSIDSNRVVTASAGNIAMAYASGIPPIADYDLYSSFHVLSTDFSVGPGIASRVDTTNNTMVFFRYLSGAWDCFQTASGTSLRIGVSSTTALSNGGDYAVKLSVVGNVMTGLVNNVTVCTGTTTVLSSGRIGVRGNSPTNTSGVAIDNIWGISR